MAQQLVEGVGANNHNYARTGRMVGYGGCKYRDLTIVWN